MLQLALALSLIQENPEALLARARDAISSGDAKQVETLFADSHEAEYLLEMARRGGGVGKLGVAMIPTPPGWEYTGQYWVTFYRPQEIEQDHDTVYPVLQTGDGLKLGAEIPEYETDYRIRDADVWVNLKPSDRSADIFTILNIDLKGHATKPRAPVFRLGCEYKLTDVKGHLRVASSDSIPQDVQADDVVRTGGLVIPWTARPRLQFWYSPALSSTGGDKVTSDVAYLTAWWVPSLARLPFQSTVHVNAPPDWAVRSEGVAAQPPMFPKFEGEPGYASHSFKSVIPISYPKVIAGKYKVAASLTKGHHTFRSMQLEPLDKERGKEIVERAAKGMAFFEKNLGAFPFRGYDVYDGLDYYGIESYSHTLLSKPISLRYATHEMGHTYFGGIVPCAYVRDSWNEGVTTYVDDILFLGNVESTLQNAFAGMRYKVPLSKMWVPYAWGGTSYWRGAYVMRMLENEIGLPAMLKGLKGLVKDRRAKDTAWRDLRPVFEKVSGKDLAWFWAQWIDGDTFPTLELSQKDTTVIVKQSGTERPYRLRFRLSFKKGEKGADQIVTMDRPEATFTLRGAEGPVKLDILGYTLATVKK